MTCGGCCGRALHRKLSHLVRLLKREKLQKDRIVVQLSSCIAKENYHGPACPHLDYLKTLIQRVGLQAREDTSITTKAEERRKTGVYSGKSRP
jgi:predicted metal-binding protein